jgi:tetratricopeptide (TPR) repeat protein
MKTSVLNSTPTDLAKLQGLMLQQNFEQALPLLHDYILLYSQQAVALRLIGHCLFELGRSEEALRHLSSALAIDPSDIITLNLIGNCLVGLSKHIEAADVFRHAISINKNCADSQNNLGMVLLDLSRPSEALPHFLKAIDLNPSHDKAGINLLNLLSKEKSFNKAHEIIQKIYSYNQGSEDFLTACSDLYFHAKMFTLCEQFALELVNKFPSQAGSHKLNRCLLQQHKHEEFVYNTLDISRLYPNNPSNIIHAVTVLLDNGEEQLSRHLLQQEVQKNPTDIEVNIALAYDSLRKMDLARGWQAFEHRLRQEPGQVHFNEKPNWNGSELHNCSVLVLAEQGIGDILLYSRFLNNLLADTEQVYLLCDPRLRCIFEMNFPQIICISEPTLLNVFEYQVSIALASLAKVYAVNVEQISFSAYIDVRQNIKYSWNCQLQRQIPVTMPRIALSLNAGIDEYNRLKRSCPFDSFLKIWPSKSMKMIDIDHHQEENHKDRQLQAQACGIELISFDKITSNLDHLCALISQLDLVITTQQTNAHICGAMGIPCIVMLPQGAHFIYGEMGDSTPWYPSLHLLRLTAWHQWDGLREPILHQLKRLFANFFD